MHTGSLPLIEIKNGKWNYWNCRGNTCSTVHFTFLIRKLTNGTLFQGKKTRCYSFTVNNPGELAWIGLKEWFLTTDWKVIMQEETGKEEKTPHIQGCCWVDKKEDGKQASPLSWNQLKADINHATGGETKDCHLESARNNKKLKEYCSKADTRSGRTWSNVDWVFEAKPYDDFVELGYASHPKAWQQDILDRIATEPAPGDRDVHWYWDDIGGAGKTIFARHLVIKYNAIYVCGKRDHILYSMTDQLKEKKNKTNIVIYDVPRVSLNHVSYGALEKIKDGIWFSQKYESAQFVANRRFHVIVLANSYPELEGTLSADRWHIVNCNEHNEMIIE